MCPWATTPRVFGARRYDPAITGSLLCVHVLRAWCPLLDPYITIRVSMMRGMLAGELPVPEDHSYATVTMECASVLECCGHPRYLFATLCVGVSVYMG